MSIDAANLRKMARETTFLEDNHREAMEAAAAELDRLEARLSETRKDFGALQQALVGHTGLSAITEAKRLRSLHPLSSS